jgi:phage tail tape-measure protein
MRYPAITLAISVLALLAACGTTPKERTTGGAAAGAATGAGIGALAGPPGVVVGALVGGGAGAATGAATSPKDVNLGKPPWTNPETRVPTPSRTAEGRRSGTTDTSQNATVDRLNRSYPLRET